MSGATSAASMHAAATTNQSEGGGGGTGGGLSRGGGGGGGGGSGERSRLTGITAKNALAVKNSLMHASKCTLGAECLEANCTEMKVRSRRTRFFPFDLHMSYFLSCHTRRFVHLSNPTLPTCHTPMLPHMPPNRSSSHS